MGIKIRLSGRDAPKRTYLAPEALPDMRTTSAVFLCMALLLWLDRVWPLWGQVAGSVIAWALMLGLYARTPRAAQGLLMSCLVVAMLGEVFCSLIWKLYDYRLFNIPAYVPPGHVLMFLMGSALAPRMPGLIVWLVPALIAPYVAAGWWLGFDMFGAPLYVMFVACLIAERERRLYATMFMLCLVLEIYGTWLGNWTWRPEVPIWGMSNTNPPISAGVFYCLLDFLMLRLALGLGSGMRLYRENALGVRHWLGGLVDALSMRVISPQFASSRADESAGVKPQ